MARRFVTTIRNKRAAKLDQSAWRGPSLCLWSPTLGMTAARERSCTDGRASDMCDLAAALDAAFSRSLSTSAQN
jgi:hypothetical protein